MPVSSASVSSAYLETRTLASTSFCDTDKLPAPATVRRRAYDHRKVQVDGRQRHKGDHAGLDDRNELVAE